MCVSHVDVHVLVCCGGLNNKELVIKCYINSTQNVNICQEIKF